VHSTDIRCRSHRQIAQSERATVTRQDCEKHGISAIAGSKVAKANGPGIAQIENISARSTLSRAQKKRRSGRTKKP
jgi:hypothetical protein